VNYLWLLIFPLFTLSFTLCNIFYFIQTFTHAWKSFFSVIIIISSVPINGSLSLYYWHITSLLSLLSFSEVKSYSQSSIKLLIASFIIFSKPSELTLILLARHTSDFCKNLAALFSASTWRVGIRHRSQCSGRTD